MKFKIALLALACLILLALVTLIILVLVSYTSNDCGTSVIETRYQCSDGRFVSNINKCPTVTQVLTTSVWTPPVKTDSTVTTSTSTLCPCIKLPPSLTTIFTSSTTLWKGPSCVSDADCGSVSYGGIVCISGDANVLVNTPRCVKEHCMTLVSYELRKVCSSSETCKKDEGCVKREE
ncbi:MAG: hypothetical protein ABH834_02000 [Candidatus Altiarchaeota archaeon]